MLNTGVEPKHAESVRAVGQGVLIEPESGLSILCQPHASCGEHVERSADKHQSERRPAEQMQRPSAMQKRAEKHLENAPYSPPRCLGERGR